MSQGHLFRLLACLILPLITEQASARKNDKGQDPIINDTCPVQVKVATQYDQALVPMQETIDFFLNPNLPLMFMKFRDNDSLYRVLVNGTMVKLYQCDMGETTCTVLTEEATKSTDYLVVHEWNRVLVKYINGEITVGVNMKVDLMGRHMIKMTEGATQGHNMGTVTFLVPPKIPFYIATVRIPCDDAAPPLIGRESYPAAEPTTIKGGLPKTSTPTDLKPFPDCPVYEVEPDHPSQPVPIQAFMAVAVYPSHPALHFEVTGHNVYFKLRVDGGVVELLTCNARGEQCSTADEQDAGENLINPGEWNDVLVHLENKEMTIEINNGKSHLKASMPDSFNGVKLFVTAPQEATTSVGSEHYTALVNVDCEGVMEPIEPQIPMPIPTPKAPSTRNPITTTPTHEDPFTLDSVVDTSTKPAPLGVSRDVGIVVGVLLAILLIIAIVIFIKKRRSSANIDHTQLQEQQNRP